MIILDRKPFDEVEKMIKGCGRLLVLGCDTCSAMCFTGGQRQVTELATAIRMSRKVSSENEGDIIEDTVARQCELEFIAHVQDQVEDCDAVLSLACGAGVQTLAKNFPATRILPALNTKFIGRAVERGVWMEMCMACGDCVLEKTAGICPVTRCAKGLLNGACGGASEGKCEVSKDRLCAWQEIYYGLKRLDSLDDLRAEPKIKNWPIHPDRVIREDLCKTDTP